MKSLRLTPPTALPSHHQPSSLPLITTFNEDSAEETLPTSDPIIILQLNIEELEGAKRSMRCQIARYQEEIVRLHDMETGYEMMRRQGEVVKEQLEHCEGKLASERKESARLRGIIEELEEAIGKQAQSSRGFPGAHVSEECGRRGGEQEPIGSKYINQIYSNMNKYFQILQEKSALASRKQISELMDTIEQLKRENKELKGWVRVHNGNGKGEMQQFLRGMVLGLGESGCKNSYCFKRNLYFEKVVGYALELAGCKKEIEAMRKQFGMVWEQFNKNKVSLNKLKGSSVKDCDMSDKPNLRPMVSRSRSKDRSTKPKTKSLFTKSK